MAGGPLPPFDDERSKVEISLQVFRWVCTRSVVFPTPPLPCGLYLERVQEERIHSFSKHCHILFRKVASFSSSPASRERGPSHAGCHSTVLILLVNECAVSLSNSLHLDFLFCEPSVCGFTRSSLGCPLFSKQIFLTPVIIMNNPFCSFLVVDANMVVSISVSF